MHSTGPLKDPNGCTRVTEWASRHSLRLDLGVQALLQAEKSGSTADKLGLLPAPHHLDADGSVRVPQKWENMVRRSDAFKEKTAAKTPPRTPPRAAQKQA